jgi:cytochrome c oxidase subunit III
MFVLIAAGIVGWWLLVRQLTAKPWDKQQSEADDDYAAAALALAPAKIGLWVFLAVVTSLFGLFISAYGMRMDVGDWRPLVLPRLLWLNTGMLVLSSVAFQRTRGAAARGDTKGVKTGLAASGLLAFGFVVGQFVAWQDLTAAGQTPWVNAANAFFYLLTGLHALHVLGGLVVWCRTSLRLWRPGIRLADVRLSVELCTVYWHYLLLVWLVLFGLLLST